MNGHRSNAQVAPNMACGAISQQHHNMARYQQVTNSIALTQHGNHQGYEMNKQEQQQQQQQHNLAFNPLTHQTTAPSRSSVLRLNVLPSLSNAWTSGGQGQGNRELVNANSNNTHNNVSRRQQQQYHPEQRPQQLQFGVNMMRAATIGGQLHSFRLQYLHQQLLYQQQQQQHYQQQQQQYQFAQLQQQQQYQQYQFAQQEKEEERRREQERQSLQEYRAHMLQSYPPQHPVRQYCAQMQLQQQQQQQQRETIPAPTTTTTTTPPPGNNTLDQEAGCDSHHDHEEGLYDDYDEENEGLYDDPIETTADLIQAFKNFYFTEANYELNQQHYRTTQQQRDEGQDLVHLSEKNAQFDQRFEKEFENQCDRGSVTNTSSSSCHDSISQIQSQQQQHSSISPLTANNDQSNNQKLDQEKVQDSASGQDKAQDRPPPPGNGTLDSRYNNILMLAFSMNERQLAYKPK